MSHTEAQQEQLESFKLMAPAELEAMLGEDEETDALINSVLGKAGGQDAEDDDGEQDEDADDDQDDGASASADAEDSPAEVAAPAEVAETPAPEAEAPSDALAALDLSVVESRYKSAREELQAEKAGKLQQMLNGEIEPSDYSKYEAEYEDKLDALKEQKAGETAWMGQLHTFKAAALKDTGINYDTDLEKGQAFDDWLKRLADNPANGSKDEAWFIAQAHKKVMAEFDIAPKAAAPVAAPAKPAPVKPTARKPNLAAIPPTLGGLPVAADNETGDSGEFAHLDSLSGMALEKAVARMTPEQRDRWATEG